MGRNDRDRHLSAAEYFLQVQREYIIAEFRRKIYFTPVSILCNLPIGVV